MRRTSIHNAPVVLFQTPEYIGGVTDLVQRVRTNLYFNWIISRELMATNAISYGMESRICE